MMRKCRNCCKRKQDCNKFPISTFCRCTCALADWRQAICRHCFSVATFLHCLIQFMIFHIVSFSAMCCYLHFLADFCWSASSSKLNWLALLLKDHRKCVTICTAHVSKNDEKYVLQRLIHMRTLC